MPFLQMRELTVILDISTTFNALHPANTPLSKEETEPFVFTLSGVSKIKFTAMWGQCPEDQKDKVVQYNGTLSLGAVSMTPPATKQNEETKAEETTAPPQTTTPSTTEKKQPESTAPSTEPTTPESTTTPPVTTTEEVITTTPTTTTTGPKGDDDDDDVADDNDSGNGDGNDDDDENGYGDDDENKKTSTTPTDANTDNGNAGKNPDTGMGGYASLSVTALLTAAAALYIGKKKYKDND